MKPRKKIVGIILTKNCDEMLEGLYKRIPKKIFDEIILVDDGSTDETISVAKKLKIKSFPHPHLGYGGNMKYGLRIAMKMGADYMVEIHGDGQYDPRDIPLAIKEIKKGYSFLLGSRFVDITQPLRDKMPLERYIANILLSFIYRAILRVKLSEFHSGFHIYSKEFISAVGFRNTSNEHIYSLEIIFQARYKGLSLCEIPIRCDYSKKHTSISIKNSVIYSFQSFSLLIQYVLAKVGLKYGVFEKY